MIYVLTTFLSAFLLFMIQPLMGKLVLPWFGGAPAVWTTCMLFFQVTLLAGYAYAHLLSGRLPPKVQAWLHVILLLAALVLMGFSCQQWGSPLLPDNDWKPRGDEAPVPIILTLLLVSIGLPYLLLAATSPLLQRWFSLAGHGARTYRLYAVSNAGSLLGLLSYPFLTERFLDLPTQAWVWALAFLLFATGCLVIVLQLQRSPFHPAVAPDSRAAPAARPRPLTILCWVFLTTSTSAMLLAVTNQLCQEVAAVPFLWVLPLSIYLLTFIISFDRPRWYNRRVFVTVTAVLTLTVLITSFLGLRLRIPVHVTAYTAFLFFFCMTCHGELVATKPHPRFLTLFYLMIALGGAFGGVFVGVIAPAIFTHYWEFNVMATLAWVVLAVVFARDKTSFFYHGDRWHFFLLVWFLAYFAIRLAIPFTPLFSGLPAFLLSLPATAAATFVIALLIVLPLRNASLPASKYWPRILVGTVIFLAECFMVVRIRSLGKETLAVDRNFFGTLRVQVVPGIPEKRPPFVMLVHGQINHGFQYLDDTLRHLPVSYYGQGSGLDTAVNHHPRRIERPGYDPESLRIGVMGLGSGNIAAFAREGDYLRFYEINPTVIDYATGERAFFTYLRDCRGETEIVLGDARLALERELREGRPQKFDVLVMDAFSSDSVPVHLLTREAIGIYAQHLRDEDSIIAVNISNRFLDFKDLVASTAEEFGFAPLLVSISDYKIGVSPSSWMLLTKSDRFLAEPVTRQRAIRWKPRRHLVWTDSFSNLFHLLR